LGSLTLGFAATVAMVRGVAFQDTAGEAVRAGDAAWQERRFDAARLAYRRALDLDSVGSSRAVFRMAVLYSWDGHLREALPLFARYTRLEPRDEEGRVALARAYAWDGQTITAVAIYDSILGRDRTYRDAALGAAQALAWAGRFRESIARYDAWLAGNRGDVDAALTRARTLAWAGKLSESEREYRRLAEGGDRPEAQKGAALVAAWRGDLFRSEAMWRAIVARYPKDTEAWVGLGQVLRWSGRPEEARDALARATALDPDNADARSQRRWVSADLAAALSGRPPGPA
jgi:tetratricopeptide (TPR) repeat protein